MRKIPVYEPQLTGNEKRYVTECLDTNWISSRGVFVERFEKAFACYVERPYAVAVTNGTVALHLALLALNIQKGMEIIVPTFTYIASVNAITYTGAIPVFADSLPDTWQVDPADIERKITPRTKALMIVHLYGHPCNMEAILDIASRYNLMVIEDCAEAFGAKYHGSHVGTFGDVAAYSFFGNKTITCGEGGMVTMRDEALHRKVAHLKGQGVSSQKQYWHDEVGYNYRMTNICAAIGLAQLEQADRFLTKKRQIAQWYQEFLQDAPVVFHQETEGVKHSFWMCSILVSHRDQREALRDYLNTHGIETRPLFYPAHVMPVYDYIGGRFPVAEDLGGRGLNLPSYPALTKDDVATICEMIRAFLHERVDV